MVVKPPGIGEAGVGEKGVQCLAVLGGQRGSALILNKKGGFGLGLWLG